MEIMDPIFSQGKASRDQLSLLDVLEEPNIHLSNLDFLPFGNRLIQFLRKSSRSVSVCQEVQRPIHGHGVLQHIYLHPEGCGPAHLDAGTQGVVCISDREHIVVR